jgi:hypothetical protein
MPAGQAEVIAAWDTPFSVEELSMRRAMAGELTFAIGHMNQWLDGTYEHLIADPDDARLTLTGRVTSALARPYYQPQDQANHYAATYLDFAQRFEVPLDRYSKVAASLELGESDGFSLRVYNFTGHILLGLADYWSFTDYPLRVASIEGMRRAALLTTRLRERGVKLEAVAGEVSVAELRNPFDLQPFEWNADEQAVIYVGPDAERGRKRHPYFY